MTKTMTMYKLAEKDATLHISKGNSKIGKTIWSFSTLPGNAKHLLFIKKKDGTEGLIKLTNVPGTCSKFCDGCARDGACYAWRDAKLHHNVVIKAWGDNTLLKRSGRIWDMIDEFLYKKNAAAMKIIRAQQTWLEENEDTLETSKEIYWDNVIKKATEAAKIRYFRIHVSGEVENVLELKRWAEIAASHPEITFCIYTKNYDALGEYLDYAAESKKNIPDNFVINVSEWHGVASNFIAEYSAKYPGAFNIFEYDDSNKKNCELSEEERNRLKAVRHCPAVDEKGHHKKKADGTPITCDGCTYCYRKSGLRTAVWAH